MELIFFASLRESSAVELADVRLLRTADFDCSRSGSLGTIFGTRLRLLFAVGSDLQCRSEKRDPVLDLLISSAFTGPIRLALLPSTATYGYFLPQQSFHEWLNQRIVGTVITKASVETSRLLDQGVDRLDSGVHIWAVSMLLLACRGALARGVDTRHVVLAAWFGTPSYGPPQIYCRWNATR